MHRSGQWFERNEGYRNALAEIHNGGHPGQETPVKTCLFCMGEDSTNGMPRPISLGPEILSLFGEFDEEEDETNDVEDDRQGRTA